MEYQKVKVTYSSLETLAEAGFEPSDDNQEQKLELIISEEGKNKTLASLTRKQQKIAEMMISGYKRKEIAKTQSVSLQSVHQIVIRMRRRLAKNQIAYGKIQNRGGCNKESRLAISVL